MTPLFLSHSKIKVRLPCIDSIDGSSASYVDTIFNNGVVCKQPDTGHAKSLVHFLPDVLVLHIFHYCSGLKVCKLYVYPPDFVPSFFAPREWNKDPGWNWSRDLIALGVRGCLILHLSTRKRYVSIAWSEYLCSTII